MSIILKAHTYTLIFKRFLLESALEFDDSSADSY